MAIDQRPLAVAVFCEDVRSEIQGTDSIVGLLPDNIVLPEAPFSFPKLALYTRIFLAVSRVPESIRIRIDWPWEDGPVIETTIEGDLINSAVEQAARENANYFGVISRLQMVNVPILGEGVIQARIEMDDESLVAAILNIRIHAEQPSQ